MLLYIFHEWCYCTDHDAHNTVCTYKRFCICNCATTYETEPDRIPTATYTHSVEMLYPVWFALCVLFLVSSVTTAKECRHTPSVMQSAELVKNAQMGGHVWIHVYGLKAPVTKTDQQAVGKTMFTSPDDYFDAWTTFGKLETGTKLSNCGGSNRAQRDCIPAAVLGISKAYVCTSAEGGLCNAVQSIKPLMVAFWYAKSNGKWILNTSYPSSHPNCF